MFKNKPQQLKIFNKNLPLINLLCMLGTLYLGAEVSPWYFLFLILVIILCLKMKINWQQGLFCLTILFVFMVLTTTIPNFSLFQLLSKLTKSELTRTKIFNWIDSTYKIEISGLIKLILFGVKNKEVIIFYKQTVDLGVVWLICVGGFHISFLSRTIYKIFKKIWKVGKWIDSIIILAYSYLLCFSYSSLRVLFVLLLNPLLSRIEVKGYNKLGFIGLIFCLLNPSCFKSYSFILSFVGVASSYFVQSLSISNKFLNSLLISIFGFVSTIPFVINMNHKISLFTFINSFIFAYLFSFIFIYFLIFTWIPFLSIVHYWVAIGCYAIVGNISYLNIYIPCNEWKPYIIFAYYSGYYALSKILYLIVYYNKI